MIMSPQFKPRPLTDLILWDSTQLADKLTIFFKIDDDIDTTLRQDVHDILKENLNLFCEKGASEQALISNFFWTQATLH